MADEQNPLPAVMTPEQLQALQDNYNKQRAAQQLQVALPNMNAQQGPPPINTAAKSAGTATPATPVAPMTASPSPSPIALPSATGTQGMPPVQTQPQAQQAAPVVPDKNQQRVDAAEAKLDAVKNSKPGILTLQDKADNIQNPFLRTIGKIGAGALRGIETAGDILLPGPMQGIPGTQLNHNMQVNQAQIGVNNAEKNSLEAAQAQEAQAKAQGATSQQKLIADMAGKGYSPVTDSMGRTTWQFTGKGEEKVITDDRPTIADPTDPTKQVPNPNLGKSVYATLDPQGKALSYGNLAAEPNKQLTPEQQPVTPEQLTQTQSIISSFPFLKAAAAKDPNLAQTYAPTSKMTYAQSQKLIADAKEEDARLQAMASNTSAEEDRKLTREKTQKEIDNMNPPSGQDLFGNQLNPQGLDKKSYQSSEAKFTTAYVTPLRKTEQSYLQFTKVLNDINAGKDLTGADSVVTLFNAIGLSAEPLKGKGFRINNNTVEEHVNARGLGEKAYNFFANLKNGELITPDQIRDYTGIAVQARNAAYLEAVEEAKREGLPVDFLPKGRGQKATAETAHLYLNAADDNPETAAHAMKQSGWSLK